MSDAPTEVEAKFEVDDADRARLAHVTAAGDFRVTSHNSIEQRDVYYDTDSAELAVAGATLRIRRSHKGIVMTFKGKRSDGGEAEAHIAERLEDEVALSVEYAQAAEQIGELPNDESLSPLQRARTIVAERALRPVAILENARTVIDLKSAADQHCEMALDSVWQRA